jgi:hypothetical protein
MTPASPDRRHFGVVDRHVRRSANKRCSAQRFFNGAKGEQGGDRRIIGIMNPVKGAKREETERSPAADYVLRLRQGYGAYARPADEARRIVDASMGEAGLTDILYESRKD